MSKSPTAPTSGVSALCLVLAPSILLSFPILLALCLLAAASLLLSTMLLVVLAVIVAPVIFLLANRPKLHLTGYEKLQVKDIIKHRKSLRTRGKEFATGMASYNSMAYRSATGNADVPVLEEIRGLLLLSDFAYMYVHFRKLIILGKMPVDFKAIMLESDKMNQSDIINGVAHKRPAFAPNGHGMAGIPPATLLFTVQRFLQWKAESLRVENIMSALTQTSRRNIFEAYPRGSGCGRISTLGVGRGRLSAYFDMGMTTLQKNQLGKDQYEGMEMFEELYAMSNKRDSDCASHALGGTLCKYSGMHSFQCFIDCLVKESEDGDKNSEEFLKIISEGDNVDPDMIDKELLKVKRSVDIVALAEKAFKKDSILYSMAKGTKSDQRIVWMNDRMGDAECVYIIAVSFQKRRVTVIFRGTTTPNDWMKNADFGVMAKQNPICEPYPGKTDSVELNNGYGEYLFVERDDTSKTKFDEIADRVHEYGEELGEGGYSVYITGHSMGGALATMFGFFASADSRFAQKGNPVRVFTFAASCPGRISFARAFQHQEKAGMLQHLRAFNDDDIVPLAHPQTERTFAHTGLALVFNQDGAIPLVKYVHDVEWWGTWMANIQTNLFLNLSWNFIVTAAQNHLPYDLAKRFENIQTLMKDKGHGEVTLDEMYSTYVYNGDDLDGDDEGK